MDPTKADEKVVTRREYLRAVLWPRGKVQEGKAVNYRYVIIGMLVTDQPILNLEGENELVIDSACQGLATFLDTTPNRAPKITLGDATSVLLSLDNI